MEGPRLVRIETTDFSTRGDPAIEAILLGQPFTLDRSAGERIDVRRIEVLAREHVRRSGEVKASGRQYFGVCATWLIIGFVIRQEDAGFVLLLGAIASLILWWCHASDMKRLRQREAEPFQHELPASHRHLVLLVVEFLAREHVDR